jgi:hypothetical protein
MAAAGPLALAAGVAPWLAGAAGLLLLEVADPVVADVAHPVTPSAKITSPAMSCRICPPS